MAGLLSNYLKLSTRSTQLNLRLVICKYHKKNLPQSNTHFVNVKTLLIPPMGKQVFQKYHSPHWSYCFEVATLNIGAYQIKALRRDNIDIGQ